MRRRGPLVSADDDLHLTSDARLAAALALALHDAHPMYSSTAGWRGGIGGQAFTQGCSFLDSPPEDQSWTQFDALSGPLRDWLNDHPGFDLEAAKRIVKEEVRWDR